MKTITLTPDASGMVDWPTLSNDKKSVVTIGSFDGMHQDIRRSSAVWPNSPNRSRRSPWWCCSTRVPRWCTLTPPNMTVRNRPQARLTRRR